ncbi:MAG: hypothetical protein EOO23_06255 [Comamonadaceae bacterium]|nr:MAG: hypothetical protein EOO23_06255 [Comamonadaceae bacterium]
MHASVFRLLHQGRAIDRDKLRASHPARGELHLRLRVNGREPQWDILLATLEVGGRYVIPCLDRARVVEIRGRWMHLHGVEVNPRGNSPKRLVSDNYRQEWWCKVGVVARGQVPAP